MITLQIIGITIAIIMIYFSFVYYKKKQFELADFLLWLCIWLSFSMMVMFPEKLNFLMETLGVIGAIPLFAIIGVLSLFIIGFFLYKITRENQRKLAYLISTLALEKAQENEKEKKIETTK